MAYGSLFALTETRRSAPVVTRQIGATLGTLSVRDRAIVVRACSKLTGTPDFAEALRALREATEELIPAGRVYVLGDGAVGPIVGSIISGVGIVEGEEAVLLVRVAEGRRMTKIGRLLP